VELLLNHLVDGPGEYVVVDMTAGADSFASGLFTRFDVTFLVCEPTVRGVGVYRQYRDHARDFGVRPAVVGNTVCDDTDLEFLREQVGGDLLTVVGRSAHVRAAERGDVRPAGRLEPENRLALHDMQAFVDGTTQDWARFQRDAVPVPPAQRAGVGQCPRRSRPRRADRPRVRPLLIERKPRCPLMFPLPCWPPPSAARSRTPSSSTACARHCRTRSR
jgi:hypothetical protein